jgi:hypothetical protein
LLVAFSEPLLIPAASPATSSAARIAAKSDTCVSRLFSCRNGRLPLVHGSQLDVALGELAT